MSSPWGFEDLEQGSGVGGLIFHDGFICFDLTDGVAGVDGVAFFLEPIGNGPFFHGGRECEHEQFFSHGGFPFRCSRVQSSNMVTGGTARVE